MSIVSIYMLKYHSYKSDKPNKKSYNIFTKNHRIRYRIRHRVRYPRTSCFGFLPSSTKNFAPGRDKGTIYMYIINNIYIYYIVLR